MSLLWVEGFESFGTTNGAAQSGMALKYLQTNQLNLTDIRDGRVAGKSLETTGSATRFQTPDLGANTTLVAGLGFRYQSLISATQFMSFYEPSNVQGVNFRITLTGEIDCRRGTTFLGSSSGLGFSTNTWKYVEVKVLIHASAGTVEVKVAGNTVINLSGIDTMAGSTAELRALRFTGAGSASLFAYDDVYILNTSGATNNDFLGNCRVDAIWPNASGDASDYTPSAGSNYQNVDDNPYDVDTTYNEDSTSTNQDLFNYDTMPNVGTIYGIQVNTVCRETDATTFSLKTLSKTGTTTSADTAQTIGTTNYTNLYRILETDPDTTSAWTESGLNSAQFGYETG